MTAKIIFILFILFIFILSIKKGCHIKPVEHLDDGSLDSINASLINLLTQYNSLNDKLTQNTNLTTATSSALKQLQTQVDLLNTKITKNASDIQTINTILLTLGKAATPKS